jgi:hypothetical protein
MHRTLKRHYLSNTQKFLIFFILVIPLLNSNWQASARTLNVQRARELINQSMKSAQNNDQNYAVLYFLQARQIHPGTPVPSWLKKYSLPDNHKEEQQLFFELSKNLDYSKAKILYEERLNLNPANQTLRKRLLKMAEKNNDEKQILRHKSALKIKDDYYWVLKLFIGIALILLIIFNGYKLFKSVKNQPQL